MCTWIKSQETLDLSYYQRSSLLLLHSNPRFIVFYLIFYKKRKLDTNKNYKTKQRKKSYFQSLKKKVWNSDFSKESLTNLYFGKKFCPNLVKMNDTSFIYVENRYLFLLQLKETGFFQIYYSLIVEFG